MDLQLDGKKALVTGSTAGIGFGIARRLANEGAEVIINGRKQEDIDTSVSNIQKETSNENVSGIVADFSKKEDVDHIIKEIPDIDILVNNVGMFQNVDFADITDEEWFEIFEVNVMSAIRLSRHYFPKMMEKDSGRIIFISSESALNIPTEMIHYGMTKTALLSISRGLARLSKGSKVTVNSILPGPTWTRGVEKMMEQQAEKTGKDIDTLEDQFFENARPTSLTQRFADVDEVASLVAYVASPLASAINGTAQRVDGGVVNNIS